MGFITEPLNTLTLFLCLQSALAEVKLMKS